VEYTYNLSTKEAEAGEPWVWGQTLVLKIPNQTNKLKPSQKSRKNKRESIGNVLGTCVFLPYNPLQYPQDIFKIFNVMYSSHRKKLRLQDGRQFSLTSQCLQDSNPSLGVKSLMTGFYEDAPTTKSTWI
jgi:hypothetical protein